MCGKLGKNFDDAIQNLQLKQVPRTPLKKNEVRLKIHATALNFFDLLMLVGKYQIKPELPFTVGSEASGEIIELGEGVKHLKLGQGVVIGMNVGALAEETIVHSNLCIPKPKQLSHVHASAIFVGFATAYNGLVHRGNLKPNETLLVTGAGGGMGAAAVQLGKHLGAKVIAAASSEEKLEVAKKLGADYTINYEKEDLKEEVGKITNNKFVDVIYEPVGGDVFEKCLRCVGDEGRLLVVGFASGKIPNVPANIPLIKGFSIVGVRSGESMRRHPEKTAEIAGKMIEWTSQGHLLPHVQVFDIDHFKEAFKLMADRKVVGKAVDRKSVV